MKKNNVLALSFAAFAALALAACDGEKGGEDKTVASIAIHEGSIASSYYINQTPSYDDLKIDLLNAKKTVLTTLAYTGNEAKITHSDIDTSSIGEGKVFTVRYADAGKSFEATMTYEVTELKYELNSWSRNTGYLSTVNASVNAALSTSESSPETGFLKKINYVIGNDNGVSLLPEIYATALDEEGTALKLRFMPSDVKATLTEKGSKTPLAIGDYLDEKALLSDGTVHFINEKTGSFTLTLSHPELEGTIAYDLEVVDGYNASSASDLFALHSAMKGTATYTSQEEADNIKAYKKEHGLPEEAANNLILQKNIQIGLSDVPSSYIWGEDAKSPSVKGSYKDWNQFIQYVFTEEKTVTVYGNGHTLSLKESGEDAFPWILTDSFNGEAQEAGKPISAHSALFYGSYTKGVDPNKCDLHIQDLLATGNMGVSAQTEITEAGPMFAKAETGVSFDNVSVAKYYMAIMGSGSLGKSVDGGEKYVVAPTVKVENSRVHDTFNSSLYLYGHGNVSVVHSDLLKSGGPLLFVNPFVAPIPYGDLSALSSLPKTRVAIDEESFLSSSTEGKGGWFSVYSGAEALSGALTNMNALFAPYSMSFLRQDTSGASPVNKFNFWLVALPQNEEGIDLPEESKGGMDVEVTRGGKVIYSTLEGLTEVLAAAQKAQQSQTPENMLAYLNALSSTGYGNNLAYASLANEMVFRASDAEGKGHFAIVNQNEQGYFLCDSLYAMKASQNLAGSGDSYVPSDAFLKDGVLSVSINGAARGGNANNPTAYTGVCNYGAILGDYHSTKA